MFSEPERLWYDLWLELSEHRIVGATYVGVILISEAKALLTELGYKRENRLYLLGKIRDIDQVFRSLRNTEIKEQQDKAQKQLSNKRVDKKRTLQ